MRTGIVGMILAVAWLVIPGWLLTQLIMSLIDLATGRYQPTFLQLSGLILFVLVVSAVFGWLSLGTLVQRYIVSLEGIEIRRLRGKRFFRWEEVESINTIPTFWFVNNLNLSLRSGENVGLLTALSARYKQSCKAIIEAAYLGNPDIDFKFVLGNDYGSPPYGIFTDEKQVDK